jgi:benzoyl-CoA reductase/2-hydroxyglutaryl-CoA dehydratase subunit BcrC/BadD/HgdB
MIELLKQCGFEGDEIESELPRVQKVFDRLGINAEDIERGKQRLNKYYDMKLQGVRKAIRLCIKELVNMVLAREDGKRKILYNFMSPSFEVLATALVSKSKDIFVANIAAPLQFVLGCIFNKMDPILEAAEQRWLKAGKVYHCGNVKTLVGLLALDLIPKPDLLVTSGQLCDTAPKTIDLIQELYGIPTWCYDSCQDREFKDYPDAKRVMDLYAKSIRRLVLKIQEVVGFAITDEMLFESIHARDELGNTFRGLQNLKETSDPVPISATHEMLWHCVNTLPYSMSDLQKVVAALNTTYEELTQRVKKGEGALEKGAPRVLSLLPPHFADPRWEHLPYELGIAVVSTEAGFYPLHGKHTLDTVEKMADDPYELIGSGLQRSLAQSLSARIAIISEVCKRLKLDGILGRYHVGCRINIPDTFIMRDTLLKELGIPVLLLEWEGFDPRFYNEEHYKRRLGLFKDVLINNRQRQ